MMKNLKEYKIGRFVDMLFWWQYSFMGEWEKSQEILKREPKEDIKWKLYISCIKQGIVWGYYMIEHFFSHPIIT
jgi:hypothetical protein